ncbi:S-layer homology domain-containing protein [Pseudoneobacillus sp. C159]
MKKKSISITLVSLLALTGFFVTSPTNIFGNDTKIVLATTTTKVGETVPFSDVPQSYWAYKEIQWLKEKGIAEPLNDDRYMPDIVMTREMAARILVKAKGISVNDPSLNSISYRDIESNDENLKYIQAATKDGIFGGYEDGTFKPKEPLTRAQMATVLVKAFGLPIVNSRFSISDMKTNHWAYKYVQTIIAFGIMQGNSTESSSESEVDFKPSDSITRAQMAAFVYHTLSVSIDDLLFDSINKDDIDEVRFLLEIGANPNGYLRNYTLWKYFPNANSGEVSMLYPAINNKNYEMIQLLIDYGANVNDRTYFNLRPLQIAIDSGEYKLAELLLKTHKVNPDGLGNSDGRSYLAYAITKKQTNIAKLLVQYGFPPYKDFSPHNISNDDPAWKGYSNPYEYAVGLNRSELVTYFQSWSWKNEYQDKNVDLSKIKLPEREFQTEDEVFKFLKENFSYLYTPVGKAEFTFAVVGSHRGSDYWTSTWFDGSFFRDIGKQNPNKYYDASTREEVKRLLKEHQEKIGTILSQINKNSKVSGRYYYPAPGVIVPFSDISIIKNENEPKDRNYFSWKNYDENSAEYYFRWYPLEDDEL